MSVEVTIICDSCSCIIHAGRSAGDVREQIARDKLGRTVGSQDQCRGCVEAGSPMPEKR